MPLGTYGYCAGCIGVHRRAFIFFTNARKSGIVYRPFRVMQFLCRIVEELQGTFIPYLYADSFGRNAPADILLVAAMDGAIDARRHEGSPRAATTETTMPVARCIITYREAAVAD